MDPLQPWLDAKEVRRLAEGLLAAPPEVEEAAVDAAYGEVFEGFAGEGDAPDLSKLELNTKRQAATSEATKKSEAPISANSNAPEQGSSGSITDQPSSKVNEVVATVAKAQEEPPSKKASPNSAGDSPFKVSVSQEHRATDVIAVKARLREGAAEVYELPSADPETTTKTLLVTAERDEPIRKLQAKGPFLSRIRQFSQVIREDLGAKAMFLIDVNGQILLDEVENAKLIQVARTLANASQRANRQSAGAAAVGNLHVKIGASSTLEVIPVDSRYGLLILGVVFPGPIGAVRVMQVADELHRTIEPSQ
ncbi:MAG: hypothetical protein P8P36_10225 [Akkermansiaceae bacterium]|nr:hypothetical protein [Akkermansiaceae bacterium]